MGEEGRIHLDRLSAKGQVFEGRLRPGELPRLRDLLANGEGELHFRIEALLDARRRHIVTCIIRGFVFLTCQATLEAFPHAVSIDDRLVLVAGEFELPPIEEESDAEDYVLAEAPLEVRDLVEESVILALPMVPRKPGLPEASEKGERPVPGRESPFAALARLKGPKRSK